MTARRAELWGLCALAALVYAGLFPNVIVHVFPNNARFMFFEPTAVGHCTMHLWFYYSGDAAEDETYRASRDEICAEWREIHVEDEDVCRRVQQGRLGAYDGGRFAPYWARGNGAFSQDGGARRAW